MFLNRLQKNPKRMEALPEDLAKLLGDESQKSKAIDMIVDAAGNEKELVGQWTASSIALSADLEKGRMIPLTEQELISRYGAVNAARVMEEKKKAGLEVDDPNCRGLKLYLHNQWQREWTKGTEESSWLAFRFHACGCLCLLYVVVFRPALIGTPFEDLLSRPVEKSERAMQPKSQKC